MNFIGRGLELEPFIYFEFEHLNNHSVVQLFCSEKCSLAHDYLSSENLRFLRSQNLLQLIYDVDLLGVEKAWSSGAIICPASNQEVDGIREFLKAVGVSQKSPLFDAKRLQYILDHCNIENRVDVGPRNQNPVDPEVLVGSSILVWANLSGSEIIPLSGLVLNMNEVLGEFEVAWDTDDQFWDFEWPSIDSVVLYHDLKVEESKFFTSAADGVWALEKIGDLQSALKKRKLESSLHHPESKEEVPLPSSTLSKTSQPDQLPAHHLSYLPPPPKPTYPLPPPPIPTPTPTPTPPRRIPSPEKSPENGDKVEILFNSNGISEWFRGTIHRVTSDGTSCCSVLRRR